MVWLSLYLCREDQAKEEAFESLKKKRMGVCQPGKGRRSFQAQNKERFGNLQSLLVCVEQREYIGSILVWGCWLQRCEK